MSFSFILPLTVLQSLDLTRALGTNIVSTPSNHATITVRDGVSNRLVNFYRGRGTVPPIWKEGGGSFVFEMSEEASDREVDIRFSL